MLAISEGIEETQVSSGSETAMAELRAENIRLRAALEEAKAGPSVEQPLSTATKFMDAIFSISSSMVPDTVTAHIIKQCCTVLDCDRTSLFMVEEDHLSLVVGKLTMNITLPKGKGLAGHVATTGETVNVPDAHLDSRFDSSFDKKSGYRTKSVLAVPMFDENKEMIAVIQCINKNGHGPFTESDTALLKSFARHSCVALNNACMYEKSMATESKLSALVDMVVSLNSDTNKSSLIFTLCHRSHQLVGADRSTLYLLDAEGKNLVVMQGDVDIRFPKTKGIAGFVATSNQVVNIPDCYQDSRFNQAIDKKTGYHTKTMLCVPIPGNDKTVIGVMQVINKLDAEVFDDEDEKLLSIMLGIAGPLLEMSNLRTQLKTKTKRGGDEKAIRRPKVATLSGSPLRKNRKMKSTPLGLGSLAE